MTRGSGSAYLKQTRADRSRELAPTGHRVEAAQASSFEQEGVRIAGFTQDSIVDGPGLRFTVFTQGCPLQCVGCHNPDTWDFTGGRLVTVSSLVAEMSQNPLLTGLTLSGGEPTQQASACTALAAAARRLGLNVWAYSGYPIETLLRRAVRDDQLAQFLGHLDVLVAGPYVQARRSLVTTYRGSTNQRLIDVERTLECGTPVDWVRKNAFTPIDQGG